MRSPRLIVVLLAVLFAPAPAAAAALAPQARIINGHPATQPWPAQVSVQYDLGGNVRGLCGGTLVSARWVLTAGHCAQLSALGTGPVRPAGGYTLYLGSAVRDAGMQAKVDLVSRHPNFSDPGNGASTGVPTFDLALLHLVSPAAQEPIRLIGAGPGETALWAPGTPGTVIGWGGIDNARPQPTQSTNLLEATTPPAPDATCSAVWSTSFDPASMFCAGGGTADTCPGDSGGPLMVPRVGGFALAGVTSWGAEECGTPGVPGVYARLGAPSINDWVRRQVPTVGFTTSPPVAPVGAPVTFTAAPGPAGGSPAFSWDTDADGIFDDAAGPTVSTAFPAAGTYDIAVRAAYPDGDRTAIAREAVVVADPPPPPPPAPLPPPPPVAAAATITNGVAVTPRMKLVTLRTRGVRARFECERACTIRGRVTLGPVSARRFGLGGGSRSVTIASGTRRLLRTGSATLTLRLTTRAKRALRNRERATISVITELRAGSVRLPGRDRVSVRR
jgi:secreted trypsin-like serine protease